MTNEQNSISLQEAGIEILKDGLTAIAQSGTFLNFGERMAVSDFSGSFMFRAITTNVSDLVCILYDENGDQIHFPSLHASQIKMGRVCETNSVVKKITVYGQCADPALPATVTLLKISNILLESVTHTRPVFTVGSCHANILVKELYISEDIWSMLEGPDQELMIYQVRNNEHPSQRSLIGITEYLPNNTDPYANRFNIFDTHSGVLVLTGSGCFAGKYCYMVVDWDSAWALFEKDGLVNSGEVILQAVINQEAASNLTLSPTIASYLEKNPQVLAPSTVFETVQTNITSENITQFLPPTYTSTAETENIFVNQQNVFAGINNAIRTVIQNNKKCINIIFDGATYFFSNGLLNNTGCPLNNVEINLIGNGSTLIGSASELVFSEYKNGYFVYNGIVNSNICKCVLVSSSGDFVSDFYGPIHEMPKLVELTTNPNADNDLEDDTVWKKNLQENEIPCKMRIPNTIGTELTNYFNNNYNNNDVSELFIQIYLDFFSQIFRVKGCTNKYIIASMEIVDGSYTSIEVNKRSAYSGGLLKPCFRLINYPGECSIAYVCKNKLYSKLQNVRLCDATNFMTVNGNVKALNISGFKFKGNYTGETDENHDDEALLKITDSTLGWVNISDCEFENIRSHVISIINSSLVSIQRNKFKHYYRGGVSCKNCSHVHVLFNELTDGNLRHYNDGAINCYNSGSHIANNKLTNYGYMGIGVGKWYGSEGGPISATTIVEYNELYMTPDYRNSLSCVPLLDGGAIYTWTKNHETIIRYNFISGHSGAMDNRGIFCDDGTYGVWLYGNMVINTKNSYAIDLRKVDTVEGNNTSNIMLYNIINGYYRFEGYEIIDTTSIKGCNIILTERNQSQPYNIVNYLNAGCIEDDRAVTSGRIEEQCAAIPLSMKNWLSVMKLPEFILSHIRYTYL